jgi:putative membrane protein
MGYGSAWGWFYGALVVVGLVLLIVVVVRLAGGGLRRDGAPPGEPSADRGGTPARRLLDERYARGEISTEEYQERRGMLDEGS